MSVFKRNGIYYVEFVQNGVRVKRSAGRAATRATAQGLERRLRTALEQAPSRPSRTFDEALERWLKGEAKGLRDHGLASHIRRVMPYVAGRRLDEGIDVAEELRAACHANGLAPGTTNRRLAIVKRVLSLAFRWGWLNEDLCRRISLERVRNERTVGLTVDDVRALADACPRSEAARITQAAAFSGLRRSELFRLGSGDLVCRDGVYWLTVRGTKNGEDRMVPIPADKLGLFNPLPFQLTEQQLRKDWSKARKTVGLTHVHFHDLRHAYGTWLSGAGANEFQISALMGHKDRRMTHRYVKRPASHLVAAVQALAEPRTSSPAADDASRSHDSTHTESSTSPPHS